MGKARAECCSGALDKKRNRGKQRTMKAYIPILIVFIFVLGFAVTNIILSHFVGTRKNTRAKLMPYECGMDPVGSAHQRFRRDRSAGDFANESGIGESADSAIDDSTRALSPPRAVASSTTREPFTSHAGSNPDRTRDSHSGSLCGAHIVFPGDRRKSRE